MVNEVEQTGRFKDVEVRFDPWSAIFAADVFIDLLMSQLRKTKTNYEFLVQVTKTTPGSMDND